MYLQRCTAEYFGPHDRLDVELPKGLVAVVGPNGSGKSKFLEAVFYSLTGNFLAPGKTEDWVKTGKPLGKAAYVEATFAADFGAFSVRRVLGGKATLQPPGDEHEVRGAKEIDRWLADRGVDLPALSRYVFPGQETFTACLSEAPAKRAEAFQRLCNTGFAEGVHDQLGKWTEALRASSASLQTIGGQDPAPLRAELAQLKGDLDARKIEQENLLLLPEAERVQLLAVIDARNKARKAFEDRQKLIAEKATIDAAVSAANQRGVRCEDDLRDAEAAHNEAVRRNGEIDARLKIAQSAKREWDAFDRAEQQIFTALNEKGTFVNPPRPDDYLAKAERETTERTLSDALRDAASAYKAAQGGVCPTCKQVTKPAAGDLAEREREYQEAAGALKDFNTRKAWWEKYETTTAETSREHARLDAVIAAHRQTPKPACDRPTHEDLTLRPVDLVATNSAVVQLRAARKTAREEHSTLTAQSSNLGGRIFQLEAVLKAAPKRDAADDANNKLQDDDAAKARHRELGVLIATLAGQAVQLENRLRQSEQVAVRVAALDGEADRLGLLRALFHRDGLARDVALANLSLVRGTLNGQLAALGLDFEVETGEDLGFTAKGQAAGRLSGGEKMLLATAFFRTWQEIGATGMDLLCLDEPTAWVDAANLHAMRDYFRRLAAAVRGQAQIIVVTHHAELTSSFDKVVALAG